MNSSDESHLIHGHAAGSCNLLSYKIVLGAVIAMDTMTLFKDLNRLSLGAATGLAAGIVIMVPAWQNAASGHESIDNLIRMERTSAPDERVNSLLSASAKALEKGMLMTSLTALVFLIVICQLLYFR